MAPSVLPRKETLPATTCPITGKPVRSDNPTQPCFYEPARMANLQVSITERYTISRPMIERNLDEE